MNIVLTGFMASGKTEISKAIAKISGRKLIDTDDLVEKHEGMSINEIFAKYGEAYFRDAEQQAVKDASEEMNAVIATGGGVVLNKENMKNLRKNGKIFNLAPDFKVIEERLTAAAATRPLLKNSSIEEIRKRFNDRIPFYDDCDYKVYVNNEKTPMNFAKEILEMMK